MTDHRYDLFISYSSKDGYWVHSWLLPRLEEAGLRISIDRRDFTIGKPALVNMEEALTQSRHTLLVLSPNWLDSDWTTFEGLLVQTTDPAGIHSRLLPLMLTDCALPGRLAMLTWADFRDGNQHQEELERLLGQLRTKNQTRAVKEPEPVYASDEMARLTIEFETTKAELESKTIAGESTIELRAKLLELRRQIREGGQRQPGEVLAGRYKLIEVIGQGGFAKVWKAWDRQRQQLVALKMLHGQHGHDRSRRERFFRGARKMAELRHPGIVGVVEQEAKDEGFHFFVMDYWDGGNFHRAVLRGTLEQDAALTIIRKVGEALAHAHEHQLVHRDVKPQNILLGSKGRACLADFDLVKAADTTGGTRTDVGMGSFLYAAPELMADAKQTGPTVDVYGLGMTTLYAFLGRNLTLKDIYQKKQLIDGLPCSLAIKAAIATATDLEEQNRFGSVDAFLKALDTSSAPLEIRTSEPIVTTPASPQVIENISLDKGHWVWIEPGSFTMGDDKGKWNREKPAHRVQITKGFWLGRYPVTNREYRRFVEARGYQTQRFWSDEGWSWLQLEGKAYGRWFEAKKEQYKGQFGFDYPEWYQPGKEPRFWARDDCNGDDQPVVGVSWHEAWAYCTWLNETLEKPGGVVTLPTEAQWEWAANGSDNRTYPWGNEQPDETRANYDRKVVKTTPVGAYPDGATPDGVHDMAGNVWEWCRDAWSEDVYKTRMQGVEDPENTDSDPAVRVLRGGAWLNGASNLRAAVRNWFLVWSRNFSVGFRCCVCRSPEHLEP